MTVEKVQLSVNAALLVVTFATAILPTAQGDNSDTKMLYNLSTVQDIGTVHPNFSSVCTVCLHLVFSLLLLLIDHLYSYQTLQDRIKKAFVVSGNAGSYY